MGRRARLAPYVAGARSPDLRAVLTVVATIAVAGLYYVDRRDGWPWQGNYRIDLDVYRLGARVWLHGGSLYGHLPTTRANVDLPFTYPPISAVVLSPLAIVSYTLANWLLTTMTIVACIVVMRLFAVAVEGAPAGATSRLAAVAVPAALLVEPVRSTLNYGQVNVLLMLLVTVDVLVVGARPQRGLLAGLAAAVKLTPLVFVVLYLVRRDFRGARNLVLSFVGFAVIGLVLAPRDSIVYWTQTVFRSDRAGSNEYAGNQSINGTLARFGLEGSARGLVWLAVSVVTVAVGTWAVHRAVEAGQLPWALVLNALIGLLVSPISWSHHWVWLAPAILLLLSAGSPTVRRVPYALGIGAVLLVAVAPQWRLPHTHHRELRWSLWQQLAGASYVVLGAVLVVVAASSRALWTDRSDRVPATP